MQIIVDVDSRRLSLGPTPPVRGETIPSTLTFMKGGVPFRLPAGTAIQIGVKSWNDPSDVLLAYTTATRPEPDGAPYTFSLSLNTSEMLAKFTAGVTRYDCSIEVKWEVSAGSGTFKKTQRHKYSVDADTVRDTDANPSTMLSRNDFLVTNGTGLLVNVAAGYAANGAFVAAQASLAITNATNYIEVTAAGVASVNTTAFTAGSYPLATVVASAGAITSNTDLRAWITPKPAAGGVTSITGTANEITVTGTTTPTLSLPSALTFTAKTVTGGTFASPTLTTPTIGDGTESAPSLSFTSDTDTGVYRPAADTVGIVGGGNDVVRMTGIASATDYLEIKNGIGVGSPLHVLAEGASANIGVHLQPKGSGLFTISDGTDFAKGIRFRSSSSAASAITLLDAVSTAGRVVTLPDATGTLALVSGDLGTPSAIVLTNASGTASGLTAGNATQAADVDPAGTDIALALAAKLPLAGGTMDENAIVNLFNGSKWQQSTPNKGVAGDAGFSVICSVGYEYKFALGYLFILSDGSSTVRKVLYAPATPTATDDTTLGFTTDTTWEMADGTLYECTDATATAAVWAVVSDADRPIFATTATAAGTTTLTVTSETFQEFTGALTQTLVMPDVTTLELGWEVTIHNLSTDFVTVQANDASEIIQLGLNQRITISTNSVSVNTSASWSVDSFNLISGTQNASSGTHCQISGESNHSNTGNYCQISGSSNHTNSGTNCQISGYNNYSNSGSYCSISGYGNTSNSGNNCSISGSANSTNSGNFCQISGESNNTNSGTHCSISGSNNSSNSGNFCSISGYGNYSNSGSHCQISGYNNHTNSGTHCSISGSGNYSNSGSYCQISGSGNYTNSGTHCSISGQINYSNSGSYCQISGYNNHSNSGTHCQIGGSDNYDNTGSYCQISGFFANNNTLDYARVHGGNEFARIIDVVAKAATTDATPTTLTLGGAAEDATNRINIPADSTWSFVATIVAWETATANAKTYTRRGLIGNNAGAVTISALDTIGTDNVLGGGLNATIAITADNTNDALKIEGTGVAATNIKWTAQVNITQVG